MKKILLVVVCSISIIAAYGQDAARDTVLMHYVDTVKIQVNDFDHILNAVTKPGTDDTEKLTLFYYWVYRNITFDVLGFNNNADYQTIQQTLLSRKGLCYEYDKLLEAACTQLKIPQYSIQGYVKFYGFKEGETLSDANHVWHAVYLNNKWLFVDLLWASGNLYFRKDGNVFKKRLNTTYFLVPPKTFLSTHLPLDPIFQFQNRPLSMAGFISKTDGIDSTIVEPYINYADSISKMNSMSLNDTRIKSAIRAYNFNKANPDILITTYYNVAVNLISKKSPTKTDLLTAKLYFTRSRDMMGKTKTPEVLALKPECERGITASDQRLKTVKG